MKTKLLLIAAVPVLCLVGLLLCTDQVAVGGSETEAFGKVVYADSTPAQGARVYLYDAGSDSIDTSANITRSPDAVTDGNGEFTVKVPSTGEYLLQIVAPPDSTQYRALVNFSVGAEGERVQLPTAGLLAPGAISGLIRSFGGYNGLLVNVALSYHGFDLGMSRVDTAGTFGFPSCPPGSYELLFTPSSAAYFQFSRPVVVSSGQTTLVFVDTLGDTSSVYARPEYVHDAAVVQAILDSNGISAALGTVVGLAEDGHIAVLSLGRKGMRYLPGIVGQLSELRSLDLHDNGCTSVPPEIRLLSGLSTLDLEGNLLSVFPSVVCSLTTLQTLRLSNNAIPSLPAGIGNLTELTELTLSGNKLSSLPVEIGELRMLQDLQLGNNALTAFPASIGNLTLLQSLTLQSNQLSSLPGEICNCVSLVKLVLTNNRITDLPASIGNLTQLDALWADRNLIRDVPSSIGNLSRIRSLDFSCNLLTTVPSSVSRLATLADLALDSNNLISLPDSLVALTSLGTLLNIEYNSLCGLDTALAAWADEHDPGWDTTQFCDPVRIISPNGGEVYHVGDSLHVTWRTFGETDVATSMVIQMSVDSGMSWSEISAVPIRIGMQAWENYSCEIPGSVDGRSTVSSTCLIRIFDYTQRQNSDVSDAAFTILPADSTGPALALNGPNGGEAYSVGDTLVVGWAVGDTNIYSVACSLSVDSGLSWFPICPGGIYLGSSSWEAYSWIIPDTLSDTTLTPVPVPMRSTRCLAKVSDFVGCAYVPADCKFDVSDSVFTIQ